MSGHISEERLNDYADGSLPGAERPALEAHLAECDVCRSRLAATRTLLGRLHALPRTIEPPAEVRSALLQAVAAPRRPAARGTAARAIWSLRYPLAAAAVLLVLATAVVTRWLVRQPSAPPIAAGPALQSPRPPSPRPPSAGAAPETPTPAQATAPADTPAGAAPRALPAAFRREETRYASEIRALQHELAAQRDRLSPATLAILERNLRVIDGAVAESRAALARDPHAAGLGRMILSAYRQKVELLRRATSFSS